VLIADKTGFLKKGTRWAGVQRQYSGTAGRTENCQIGVFLAYASVHGHALIDRELYLPRSWTDDADRCREVGIPAETEFATKPQLAQAMISRALEVGVPFSWFTAGHPAQRHPHHARRRAAGRRADRRAPAPGSGSRPEPGRTARASTTGRGSRSGRTGNPAAGTGCWPAAPCTTPARSPTTPASRSSTADLAWTAGSRWHIEECFQQAKGEAGLDHYQVRTWRAWYAHVTLSMLALAWLAASKAQAVKGEPAPATRA
jgi:SRSO17 transposase